MYEFPVLFPAISNRESFVQTIQIADDETGDLITLTNSSGNLVSTGISGNVVTFASVPPSIQPGWSASDASNPTGIPANTLVTAVSQTTITLSSPVSSPGVVGDTFQFVSFLYQIYLEIAPTRRGGYSGNYASPYYYDCAGEPLIFATLSNYLSIPDTGTIQVQIPYTVMQTLRRSETYDVYLRIVDVANVDARQLLIGKLPVHCAGHSPPSPSSGGLT